eukprot:GHVU01176384.1.p2 GENE.GHVU01176384.1~~GHVU01176384.1.p2  ORF type:complete len:122 (-),score=11.73 GHVU01176384.1:1885-2250(-)
MCCATFNPRPDSKRSEVHMTADEMKITCAKLMAHLPFPLWLLQESKGVKGIPGVYKATEDAQHAMVYWRTDVFTNVVDVTEQLAPKPGSTICGSCPRVDTSRRPRQATPLRHVVPWGEQLC